MAEFQNKSISNPLSVSASSPNFEKLTICEELLSLIISTPRQDVDFLVAKSNDLITNLNKLKPDKEDYAPNWENLLKRVASTMSALQDLHSLLLYNYSRVILISENKDIKKAILILERVIKAAPQLCQAWNDLGDCFWENGQSEQALNCFLGAVEHDEENKEGLRNLSIIYRQLSTQGTKEYNSNLLSSVQFAQRAVNCDKDDGLSWMILGNARLSEHFNSHASSNNSSLKKCLTCYHLAENDPKAICSPDLYSNLGTVQICLEEFTDALHSYSKAIRIEPQSSYLQFKLSSILQTFRDIKSAQLNAQRLPSKTLSENSKKCQIKYDDILFLQVQFSELIPGEDKNAGNYINLCVHQIIHQKEMIPCIVICIDASGNTIVCSLYGVKQVGVFSQGDVISVISPILKHKVIKSECGISIDCHWISCFSFEDIRLNGRVLTKEYLADSIIEHQAFTNFD